jgi:uncharacterized membrane protein YvbJ
MESQIVCHHCKSNVGPSDYFCPNCGKKLREKPQSTALLKQLLVYTVSFFLPPLGLWPAIKYLRQPDQKSRCIGWAAIILTIVSVILSVYLSVNMLNSLNEQLYSELNMYQNLGI